MLVEFINENLDREFQDGSDYEHALIAMVARFKNAYEGVLVAAAEAAMRAEIDGDLELLEKILNRQLHFEDSD